MRPELVDPFDVEVRAWRSKWTGSAKTSWSLAVCALRFLAAAVPSSFRALRFRASGGALGPARNLAFRPAWLAALRVHAGSDLTRWAALNGRLLAHETV